MNIIILTVIVAYQVNKCCTIYFQASGLGLNTRFHFWMVVDVYLMRFAQIVKKWGDGNLLLVRPTLEQSRPARCFLSHLPTLQDDKVYGSVP